ncbi:hypothetical protein NESM_000735300 [Novymonas esmeraldas]|uniref:C2H2-type domain-containing protein n=1 Tax=Novymonas esmeraldas TaxID=1808958 RepID=A0AAW0EW38_9TRYP
MPPKPRPEATLKVEDLPPHLLEQMLRQYFATHPPAPSTPSAPTVTRTDPVPPAPQPAASRRGRSRHSDRRGHRTGTASPHPARRHPPPSATPPRHVPPPMSPPPPASRDATAANIPPRRAVNKKNDSRDRQPASTNRQNPPPTSGTRPQQRTVECFNLWSAPMHRPHVSVQARHLRLSSHQRRRTIDEYFRRCPLPSLTIPCFYPAAAGDAECAKRVSTAITAWHDLARDSFRLKLDVALKSMAHELKHTHTTLHWCSYPGCLQSFVAAPPYTAHVRTEHAAQLASRIAASRALDLDVLLNDERLERSSLLHRELRSYVDIANNRKDAALILGSFASVGPRPPPPSLPAMNEEAVDPAHHRPWTVPSQDPAHCPPSRPPAPPFTPPAAAPFVAQYAAQPGPWVQPPTQPGLTTPSVQSYVPVTPTPAPQHSAATAMSATPSSQEVYSIPAPPRRLSAAPTSTAAPLTNAANPLAARQLPQPAASTAGAPALTVAALASALRASGSQGRPPIGPHGPTPRRGKIPVSARPMSSNASMADPAESVRSSSAATSRTGGVKRPATGRQRNTAPTTASQRQGARSASTKTRRSEVATNRPSDSSDATSSGSSYSSCADSRGLPSEVDLLGATPPSATP